MEGGHCPPKASQFTHLLMFSEHLNQNFIFHKRELITRLKLFESNKLGPFGPICKRSHVKIGRFCQEIQIFYLKNFCMK